MNEGASCKIPPKKAPSRKGWWVVLFGACGVLCCGLAPLLLTTGAGLGLGGLLAWGSKFEGWILAAALLTVLLGVWFRWKRNGR